MGLYILYTNEIPLLYRIINSTIFTPLTGNSIINNINNVSNYVIQYVDDSTSMITTSDINDFCTYCDQLFKVLECYYNLNKLTLNSDKTTFMIVCKASLRTPTLHIKLNTTNFVIEQAKKVKILGTYFSPGLCNVVNVNSIISKVNYRLNIIRK